MIYDARHLAKSKAVPFKVTCSGLMAAKMLENEDMLAEYKKMTEENFGIRLQVVKISEDCFELIEANE